MRFAVWGCGSIGRRHIKNLLTLGIPAEVIFCFDPSLDVLCGLPDGVQVYAVKEHMPQPDAVLICSPADRHTRDLEDMRTRLPGVPFLVEKPATTYSPYLSERILRAFDETPHLVACNLRWRPEALDLQEFVSRRDVVFCELVVRADMSGWPGSSYGSAIFECCHEIDLAFWLMGASEIQRVDVNESERGIWFKSRRGFSRVTIDGSSPKPLRHWEASDKSGRIARGWVGTPEDINECYLDEMRHFFAVMYGQETSVNTLRDAALVVKACEKAEAMVAVGARARAAWSKEA